MLSNSSIKDWIEFDGHPPNYLKPCVDVYNVNISSTATIGCDRVCNNSDYLFSVNNPENLVNCGLWSSINNPLEIGTNQTDYKWNTTIYNDHLQNSSIDALLAPFAAIGLSNDQSLAIATRNVIGNCFSALYALTRSGSSQDDGRVIANCTTDSLFPALFLGDNITAPLGDCLDAICSPKTLNPDLGGIGVDRTSADLEAYADIVLGLHILPHADQRCNRCTDHPYRP